ncbi:MAG: hypothetical protein J0J15_27520, partial [Mesorhizobium sp.]|nr:hypothetical protein [Mesorhizobium sp.]
MILSQSVKQIGRVGFAQRGVSQALAILVLATVSASLAFHNIDFPYGRQPDEPLKVALAAGQHHNYAHPPLLIVLA